MTAKQEERLKHIPGMYRGLFERLYNGASSRAQRIKAKCLDCCGYERLSVRECAVECCPLWPIRPYQANGAAGTANIEGYSNSDDENGFGVDPAPEPANPPAGTGGGA